MIRLIIFLLFLVISFFIFCGEQKIEESFYFGQNANIFEFCLRALAIALILLVGLLGLNIAF